MTAPIPMPSSITMQELQDRASRTADVEAANVDLRHELSKAHIELRHLKILAFEHGLIAHDYAFQ